MTKEELINGMKSLLEGFIDCYETCDPDGKVAVWGQWREEAEKILEKAKDQQTESLEEIFYGLEPTFCKHGVDINVWQDDENGSIKVTAYRVLEDNSTDYNDFISIAEIKIK